jgi:hypothetical protein
MTLMAKKIDKSHLYQIHRFSPEQLMEVQHNVAGYALAIGGLPRNHAEVFEKRGWMLPFLFAYDNLLWGRWSYWHEILYKGTIAGSGPIPKIKWTDMGHDEVRNMLRRCLDHHESTIDHFADWLLWGLAATKESLRISKKLNEHYYRNFDLFLVQNYPFDYLSQVLCDETGRGYKAGLGYFPTPMNVTRMMVEMTVGNDAEKMKRQTVMDPCVGCGAMLLPASNYYLRGYGQDISLIATKLCKIQMYWYAPWYAFHPEGLKGFDDHPPIPLAPSSGRNIAPGQMALMFEEELVT